MGVDFYLFVFARESFHHKQSIYLGFCFLFFVFCFPQALLAKMEKYINQGSGTRWSLRLLSN